jgi:DNA-binding PadR family transcriptional regulator
MESKKSELSSYQKGINRLFEHREKFERVIIEYILFVNSTYGSNMFPTPQIAKIMVDKLQFKKTQFPIIHKIVREILNEWEQNGWVEYVTTTKSGRNRRTKFIYRFTPENLELLKGRFIGTSIRDIELERPHDEAPLKDTLKSRERILQQWIDDINEVINNIEPDKEEIEEFGDEDDVDEENDSQLENIEEKFQL